MDYDTKKFLDVLDERERERAKKEEYELEKWRRRVRLFNSTTDDRNKTTSQYVYYYQ